MTDQLYRQPKGAMLGGVCGGLSRYFRVDETLVRILFLLFGVLTGFGVVAYLALWIILPVPGESAATSRNERGQDVSETLTDRATALGSEIQQVAQRPLVVPAVAVTLIAFGSVLLLRNLGVRWVWWATPGTLWPTLPILVGLAFLWRWLRGRTP
jgi:phage shock protein PspC (stress-responsive transcriptional regulator)